MQGLGKASNKMCVEDNGFNNELFHDAEELFKNFFVMITPVAEQRTCTIESADVKAFRKYFQ